jgi:hypothetical protein
MSEYKGIKGFSIQNLSADPADPNEGQVWYNSTSGSLKVTSVTTSGSWATGGNLNTARGYLAGAGTQTTGLAFGGASPSATGATESYDGSAWTTLPATLAVGTTSHTGTGTQTAALSMGGNPPAPGSNVTEEYNGTSWTPGGNLNTNRYALASCGIQTAALAFGGFTDGPGVQGATEEYDGTSWTSNPTGLNTARNSIGGCGTQTAGLAFNGYTGTANSNATEEYNGSTWTSVNPGNSGRYGLGCSGSQTNAVAFGGFPLTAATETYDGTSWTTSPVSMSTARATMGKAGQTTALALAFGGSTPPYIANTEEWTGPGAVVTKTITIS